MVGKGEHCRAERPVLAIMLSYVYVMVLLVGGFKGTGSRVVGSPSCLTGWLWR